MSNPNSENNKPFMWDKPITVFDKLTIINCFTNTILFDILAEGGITARLIEHPYFTTFGWIMTGGFWSMIGINLTKWNNSDKSISWFATNGVVAFGNILMLRKLLMIYKQSR